MDIIGSTLQTLEKALDLRMINQRVITSNLANVDTPGYVAQRMDFVGSMQRAVANLEAAGSPAEGSDLETLARRALGQVPSAEAIIAPSNDPALGLDGNNVDMEGELSRLDQNNLMYQMTAQLLAAKMRQLQSIIQGDGG